MTNANSAAMVADADQKAIGLSPTETAPYVNAAVKKMHIDNITFENIGFSCLLYLDIDIFFQVDTII